MKKKLMTPETVKVLEGKVKFSNKVMEVADGPLFNLVNNILLDKLAEKLPEATLEVVQATLKEVIDEMPEIEI